MQKKSLQNRHMTIKIIPADYTPHKVHIMGKAASQVAFLPSLGHVPLGSSPKPKASGGCERRAG